MSFKKKLSSTKSTLLSTYFSATNNLNKNILIVPPNDDLYNKNNNPIKLSMYHQPYRNLPQINSNINNINSNINNINSNINNIQMKLINFSIFYKIMQLNAFIFYYCKRNKIIYNKQHQHQSANVVKKQHELKLIQKYIAYVYIYMLAICCYIPIVSTQTTSASSTSTSTSTSASTSTTQLNNNRTSANNSSHYLHNRGLNRHYHNASSSNSMSILSAVINHNGAGNTILRHNINAHKMNQNTNANSKLNHYRNGGIGTGSSGIDATLPFIGSIGGCSSCQQRKVVEDKSLASFKKHILHRLEMMHPPNITKRPQIADNVLKNFYQNSGYRYIWLKNNKNQDGGGGNEQYIRQIRGSDVNNNDDEHRQQRYHHRKNYRSRQQQQTTQSTHHHHHHHQQQQQHHHHHNRMYGDDPGIIAINDKTFKTDNDYLNDDSDINYDDNDDDYEFDDNDDGYEDENEEFFSTTNSIYAFPKFVKARHRGDILEFSIKENSNLAVSQAYFHMHIHGKEWIKINEPKLFNELLLNKKHYVSDNDKIDVNITSTPAVTTTTTTESTSTDNLSILKPSTANVTISINRLLRGVSQQKYTRIDSDYTGTIPNGYGVNVKFNITDMVIDWMTNNVTNQEVVVKTLETWMRNLLLLDTNSENGPYIEIHTRDIRRKRTKRSAVNCRDKDNHSYCCRYPLLVDFREFGWDWIIAPDIYEAFYCSGECATGFLSKYPHSYILQLSSSYAPCCSPTKLSPLSLLYFDDNKQVIHSIIPNMAVEQCSCS